MSNEVSALGGVRRTCHLCGHCFPENSSFLQCSNRMCDKTSGQPSIYCEQCIKLQHTYFQARGIDIQCCFVNISWTCLDCRITNFPLLPVGLCCCTFRRHKLKCALHPDQDHTSKLHCHSYHRKPFPEVTDVSASLHLPSIQILNYQKHDVLSEVSQSFSSFTSPAAMRMEYSAYNHVVQITLDLSQLALLRTTGPPEIAALLTDESLSSRDELLTNNELKLSKNRKTCHWCGKMSKPSKRGDAVPSRYCSNIYCEKTSGQAQFICGPCFQRQSTFFSKCNVDVRNVFGDIDANEWFCLDCCQNELGIGSCCCTFRRFQLPCALHGESEHIDGARYHCHSFYSQKSELPTIVNSVGRHLSMVSAQSGSEHDCEFSCSQMHVPLTAAGDKYDFKRRSFSQSSAMRARSFFDEVLRLIHSNKPSVIENNEPQSKKSKRNAVSNAQTDIQLLSTEAIRLPFRVESDASNTLSSASTLVPHPMAYLQSLTSCTNSITEIARPPLFPMSSLTEMLQGQSTFGMSFDWKSPSPMPPKLALKTTRLNSSVLPALASDRDADRLKRLLGRDNTTSAIPQPQMPGSAMPPVMPSLGRHRSDSVSRSWLMSFAVPSLDFGTSNAQLLAPPLSKLDSLGGALPPPLLQSVRAVHDDDTELSLDLRRSLSRTSDAAKLFAGWATPDLVRKLS